MEWCPTNTPESGAPVGSTSKWTELRVFLSWKHVVASSPLKRCTQLDQEPILPARRGVVTLALAVLFAALCSTVQAQSAVYPVLGINQTDPLNNVIDPLSDGWFVKNGFGTPCISCSGSEDYPYHPGVDYNRADGKDADNPVYAIADGQVIRCTELGGDRGWAVIILHTLAEPIGVTSYFVID